MSTASDPADRTVDERLAKLSLGLCSVGRRIASRPIRDLLLNVDAEVNGIRAQLAAESPWAATYRAADAASESTPIYDQLVAERSAPVGVPPMAVTAPAYAVKAPPL